MTPNLCSVNEPQWLAWLLLLARTPEGASLVTKIPQFRVVLPGYLWSKFKESRDVGRLPSPGTSELLS